MRVFSRAERCRNLPPWPVLHSSPRRVTETAALPGAGGARQGKRGPVQRTRHCGWCHAWGRSSSLSRASLRHHVTGEIYRIGERSELGGRSRILVDSFWKLHVDFHFTDTRLDWTGLDYALPVL